MRKATVARSTCSYIARAQDPAGRFTSLLASIAAVSLLVGGIGIMNIMMQFLIEALTLCLLGGLIGVLLGVGTAVLLSKVMQWNILISPMPIAIAFAFSAAVGLFFGIWPARRASKLDPITALRYE